jgi:uncharacterized protein YjbI with pentapeptide repeats
MRVERQGRLQVAEELLEHYRSGRRDFRGLQLRGAYLRGVDLHGVDLSDANLGGADLQGAGLCEAILCNVDARSANLRYARLDSADLWQANMCGADLRNIHLCGANLREADLTGANLRSADLTSANLRGADLGEADLRGADLSGATFIGASLRQANLSRVDLGDADLATVRLDDVNLTGSNLKGARLREANLVRAGLADADLTGADLRGANLGGALLRNTHLVGVDLSPFCDASPAIEHAGPSNVDHRAVALSVRIANLDVFLQRTGMPTSFVIEMVKWARTSEEYGSMMQTTFISYGGRDEAFARKLYEALHRNGVATFFFPEHAVPGKTLHGTMREGVNSFERVILICSKSSLRRPGVLNEIEETLRREAREGGASYLIPIALDDYVFRSWKPTNALTAQTVRDRVVGDFNGADKDDAKFDAGVLRLLIALKK